MRPGLPVLLPALLFAPPALAAWSPPQTLCTIRDARITEASGIGMSRRNPGVFYVHNDSGDTARFWAVSKTGAVLAEFTLPGVTAVDWEDLAVGYGTGRRPTVFIADIGDNLKERAYVSVYAVEEPAVPAKPNPRPAPVAFRTLRFRYPDGAHDAETLMADHRGRALYVVTKEPAGPGGVYRIPAVWDGAVQTAVKVAGVTFHDPIPQFANLATGGDIAPDGSRVVVRTYQQAYEWTVEKGELPEDAMKRPPVVVPIVLERQGEAICYGLNGKAILTMSEGTPANVSVLTWGRAGK